MYTRGENENAAWFDVGGIPAFILETYIHLSLISEASLLPCAL